MTNYVGPVMKEWTGKRELIEERAWLTDITGSVVKGVELEGRIARKQALMTDALGLLLKDGLGRESW